MRQLARLPGICVVPAALLAVLLVTLLLAAPASAHDVDDPGGTGLASNARSTIVSHTLPPGVTVDVLQNGQALHLRNDSPAWVYLPESGLRVPPGGSVRWHHDDAHPPTPDSPVPGQPVVRPWRLVVEVDAVPYAVRGEVRWTPGPPAWPWLAGATLVAGGLAGWAGLTRRRRGPGAALRLAAAALGTAVLASIVHTGAALVARTADGPRWALLADYLPQIGCWGLGSVAVLLLVRHHRDGTILGILAAAGLVLVTLIRDAAVLGASTVLVALPANLDRALVAGTMGLAAGVLAALASGLVINRRLSQPGRPQPGRPQRGRPQPGR